MLTIRIATATLFLIPCAKGMENIEDFLDYKNLIEGQSVIIESQESTSLQSFPEIFKNLNDAKNNLKETIKRCEETTKTLLNMTHRVDETNQHVKNLDNQIKQDLENKNNKKVGTSSFKTEIE
jgi:predicted nuclease with TOPRIM domain